MTSKELLRRIDKKNYLTEREHREFLDRLNKDLEDYEELKKLMVTPIQDIMKKLKVLEIFKKIFMLKITIGVDKVDAEIPSDKIIFKLDELNNEEKDIIWEWLRNWLNE